jgi:hypothetical protein
VPSGRSREEKKERRRTYLVKVNVYACHVYIPINIVLTSVRNSVVCGVENFGITSQKHSVEKGCSRKYVL